LDDLAEQYRDEGLDFIFLYTSEAHPGDAWPHHTAMEEKINRARQFVSDNDLQRRMMVDSLDGQLHRAYGALPNMSWIISSSGEVVYKANWTDARSVGAAIDQLLAKMTDRQGTVARSAAPPRSNSRDDFMQGLLDVPGPRAAREFVEAVEATSGPGAGSAMRQWLADHRHPME
jgi:hypothetical protein